MKDATNPILADLDRLPPDEREAIVTAFYGHCSYHEAARTLGESDRSVKLRIRSGLRRLAVLHHALSPSPTTTAGDGS